MYINRCYAVHFTVGRLLREQPYNRISPQTNPTFIHEA